VTGSFLGGPRLVPTSNRRGGAAAATEGAAGIKPLAPRPNRALEAAPECWPFPSGLPFIGLAQQGKGARDNATALRVNTVSRPLTKRVRGPNGLACYVLAPRLAGSRMVAASFIGQPRPNLKVARPLRLQCLACPKLIHQNQSRAPTQWALEMMTAKMGRQ